MIIPAGIFLSYAQQAREPLISHNSCKRSLRLKRNSRPVAFNAPICVSRYVGLKIFTCTYHSSRHFPFAVHREIQTSRKHRERGTRTLIIGSNADSSYSLSFRRRGRITVSRFAEEQRKYWNKREGSCTTCSLSRQIGIARSLAARCRN